MSFTQEEILSREKPRLVEVIETGPHPAYQDPGKTDAEALEAQYNEWVFDFSWNEHSLQEWQWLLDDAQYMELVRGLKHKWGFDLEAFIRTCIADSEEMLNEDAATAQYHSQCAQDEENGAMDRARDGLE